MSEQQCKCGGEAHQGHLCVLTSKGMTEEIGTLTNAPTVVCFVCGREANCAENVCSAMPLAEKQPSSECCCCKK